MTKRAGEERGTPPISGMSARIEVAGQKPYSVVIGHNLMSCVPEMLPGAAQVAVICAHPLRERAATVATVLRAAGMGVVPIEVPDAEAGKTIEIAARCWDALGAARFTRTDAVVGIGGGAVTDLAGFVAASWLRGSAGGQCSHQLVRHGGRRGGRQDRGQHRRR